ncbi:MAG: carbamoyltransferase HypF [Rugosibacter sp.]|nr:carbamoyltransferase HypF [Rugosibacter sp.]
MMPEPTIIPLAKPATDVVALGGGLKNTVCVTRGAEAHISPVIGDLDLAENCAALESTLEGMCRSLAVTPRLIAHDLHPDFFSTRLAHEITARHGGIAIGVQHHHAHIASVCAEHGHTGPVLGLALDGFGLGDDGEAWGGELLMVDGSRCERLDHLYRLRLPGGDRAAREPWRMAASALHALERSDEVTERFATQPATATVNTMLRQGFNCPFTSSMGRLFDAAAGLLDVCQVQRFEGEAAMLLQQLAERHGAVPPVAQCYRMDDSLDFRPLLSMLADDCDAGYGAAVFHATLAAGLAEWVQQASSRHDIRTVACGGGCFLNQNLLQQLSQILQKNNIQVLTARQLSPGDSGLSLGQAWVALHHSERN